MVRAVNWRVRKSAPRARPATAAQRLVAWFANPPSSARLQASMNRVAHNNSAAWAIRLPDMTRKKGDVASRTADSRAAGEWRVAGRGATNGHAASLWRGFRASASW